MKKIASFFSIIFLGIILVACGGDKKYTVTYDVTGGTPNIAAVEVKENGLVTKPSPDPTKVGYTFEYWIESESKTEWKFATQKVTKNITLVAKWKENTPVEQKVKVTFNIGYDGGTHPTAQEIVKGAKASEPTGITRDGYIFLGWYKGDDKFEFTTAINENITLTAKWQLNVPAEEKVTVTFDINYEGGVNPPAQEIKKGTTAVAPTGITRDGYTFLGWYNGGVPFVFATALNANITLTAEWEPEIPAEEKATVTFNINYPGGVNPASQEIKKGTTAVEPTGITRDGYTFLGWYNGDIKFEFTTAIDTDVTLTAEWQEIILEPQFTTDLFISEYIEGGSYNKAIEIYNGTGSTIDLSNYRVTMHNFNSKNIYNESQSVILSGQLEHDSVFVLAHKDINNEVKHLVDLIDSTVINFNGNDPVYLEKLIDGLWTSIDAFGIYVENQNQENFAIDNTYVRKGTVTGPTLLWNKNDWNILDKDTLTELGSHEYSLLPPITSYTVSFDSNGGSAVESQTVNEGKKATLPTPNPTLDGYTFVGWYLGEAAYVFATPITDDITLTAKWELITVADVTNEAELKAALGNENIREINLLNHITLEEKLVLLRSDVAINGHGYKLSLLNVSGWQGAYILQAYKVTEVVITDLVFEGGDAALYVNGSEVTVENITLNDHEFGGIEVSQGVGVETTPKLTVIGQLDSNIFELPYIWIDKAIVNDGWVILPAELALDEVPYTEAGKQQVWFIDQTVDETAPVLLEKTLQIIDGKLVLVIKAQDDNLYSLEVDHSLNNNEFTVYASEQDPYGGQQAAFEALDVVVVFADGTWTITFGNGAMTLIKGVTQLNEFKVHVVIKDHAGNAFGSMSPTTAENTVSINIYNLDLVEDKTTINTVRLFAGELVVLTVLDDKGELLFAGWFTDEELTNEYTEAIIEGHLTLYAKFAEGEAIVKEVLSSDFSEGKTSLTSLGWEQGGLGGDYAAGNPRLKFDSTGDWIKSPEFSLKKTATVTVFYRNNGISGSSKVEFFDQNDTLIYTFNSFVNQNTNGNIVFEIDVDVTSVKIMYTKGAGNLGVGSFLIEHNI